MEAQRLTPNRPGYQLLVARLLVANGQPAKAADAVRRTFGSEAVALWKTLPPALRDAGPAPKDTMPPGAISAYGKLLSLNCGDYWSRTPLHLNVQLSDTQPPRTIDLTANNRTSLGFDDTSWIGGGHAFVCHAAINRPAHVVYKPGTKGYGELFSFSVTDDLPPAGSGSTASLRSGSPSTP